MASRKKPVAPSSTPREAAIAAALARAADGSWRETTLRDLANATVLPFGEIYAAFRSTAHVAGAVLEGAIDAALAEPLPDASLSPKDRIFDAAMNVFDALKDRRAGWGAMLATYRLRPLSGAPVWRAMTRAARVSLERAGVGVEGAVGTLRVAALTRTLSLVFAVFAEDEDGLSRTMAALDTRLREAERWAKRLGWGRDAEEKRA